MAGIKFRTMYCVVAACLALGVAPVVRAQTLQITSPSNGATVNPGQDLSLTVTPSGGTSTDIVILGEHPIGSSQNLTSPPYQFTIEIPATIGPRIYTLTATGLFASGQGVDSAAITIDVERADTPASMDVNGTSLDKAIGDTAYLRVGATYSDASVLDVTESTPVTYTSDTPPGPGTIRALGIKSGSKKQFSEVPITLLLPAKVTSQLTWPYYTPQYIHAHPGYLVRGCAAALLLALLCSYGRPKVRKLHHLVIVGMLGAISALPLQAYLLHHPWIDGMQWEFSGFALAYGFWPVVVLSYIYWVRSFDKTTPQRESVSSLGSQEPFGLIEPPGAETRLAAFLREATNVLPVTAFFLLTGTWSASLCDRSITPDGRILLLIPLPFAVPAAMLLLRSWRAVLAAPLFVVVWLVAYACALVGRIAFIPMLIGGSVGAVGLALSCRVALARFRGPERSAALISEHLSSLAILGCVAALPFQIRLSSREMDVTGAIWEFRELAVCFAVWQALVGSYLYWLCSRALDGAKAAHSESGEAQ